MTASTTHKPAAHTQPPTAILIIRHGEKPPDSDDHPASAHHPAGPPFGVEIDGTHYADAPKHRTYQTVWPLAAKLGTKPTVTVPVGHESELASWVLQQSGQIVLVCWEHQHIEDLTNALGPVIAGGNVPGPWPSDRFDIVVALTADPGAAGHYLCTQVPQLLLAGDSSQPIPGSPQHSNRN